MCVGWRRIRLDKKRRHFHVCPLGLCANLFKISSQTTNSTRETPPAAASHIYIELPLDLRFLKCFVAERNIEFNIEQFGGFFQHTQFVEFSFIYCATNTFPHHLVACIFRRRYWRIDHCNTSHVGRWWEIRVVVCFAGEGRGIDSLSVLIGNREGKHKDIFWLVIDERWECDWWIHLLFA